MKARILVITLVLLTAISAGAQTVTFVLGAHGCGNFTGTYYCDEIPITNVDGSWPTPNNSEYETAPFVFSDILHNSQLNGFFMLTNYGMGNGTVTSYNVVTLPTDPLSYQMNVLFNGPMLDANYNPTGGTYTATVQYVFTIGKRSCNGRACATPWQILGGTGTATVMPAGQVHSSSVSGPTKPVPEIGTEYLQVCGWDGVIPPYLPTGRIGIQGIQVGAQCSWYNTVTGTYSSGTWTTWWIPWATWFFPPAQIPACEGTDNACQSQINVQAVGASTPQHPTW